MKVVFVAAGNFNKMTIALYLKVKEDPKLEVSIIVCEAGYWGRTIKIIRQAGLKQFGHNVLSKLGVQRFHGNSKRDDNWFLQGIINSMANEHFISIRQLRKRYKFSLYNVKRLNDKGTIVLLRHELKPDIIINLSGEIVRKNIIEVPKIGVLNYHMGILPKYRGMNTLEWSLFNDDDLGITIHFVDEGIDSGDILKVVRFDKGEYKSVAELRAKANRLALDSYLAVLQGLWLGILERKKQRKTEGKQYFVMHERLRRLLDTGEKRDRRRTSMLDTSLSQESSLIYRDGI